MKSISLTLFLLCCLFCLLPALGGAETLTYTNDWGSFSADSEAEYIDLGRLKIPNRDADYARFEKYLAQFPNLKQVDMFATEIKRPRIEELAARFPDIEFGWTMVIPCYNPTHSDRSTHYIRTDATAFSTLHSNSCLEHTALDFSILKYCKNLQALDIGHNRVTDLSFLYDLPHLKVLIVACNIDLVDISPIGSLTELEYLEIFKNKIEDISCLANCTKLIDLNICFNHIKDWTPLYGLTRLRRLWLYNSNSLNYSGASTMPEEAVQALRDALPDCTIDSVHWSTEGGWRSGHPRYLTIAAMFSSMEYIPFTDFD